jgi:hypothetical protein
VRGPRRQVGSMKEVTIGSADPLSAGDNRIVEFPLVLRKVLSISDLRYSHECLL